MRTKSITLFYKLTQSEIFPPSITELERKDNWIKEVQKTIEADWKPLIIKVSYEMFNPEIEDMRKFFEGACVSYYTIQNEDMTENYPNSALLKQYREDILDEMLGYDYQGAKKIHRMRKSTTDFKEVAMWNKFLKTLQETLFDSAGFEFPDSKEFWELVKVHGYEEAKKISVQKLQNLIKCKQYDKN